MEEKRLSKKELKALRKLEKLDRDRVQAKSNMVKWIAFSAIGALFLAFFVVLIIFTKQNKEEASATPITMSDAGHVRGASGAAVTLVEYADIQCPACQAYHPVVKEVLVTYEGQVKVLFKHFPLTGAHKNAMPAAIAAEAAGNQNKFFEMVDLMYEKQAEWQGLANPRNTFIEYAQSLGLDTVQFEQDLEDASLQDTVEAQVDEGIKNGVNGTPTFFINSAAAPDTFERVENPGGLDEFKQIIDPRL